MVKLKILRVGVVFMVLIRGRWKPNAQVQEKAIVAPNLPASTGNRDARSDT